MGNTETAVHNNVAADNRQLKILVVLPLTRKWAIDMQAKQLAALNRSSLDLHLLVDQIDQPEDAKKK